ncbi:hypothetical protein [Actinacidiphila sp. ITFR-21]|uniref:hypothetical protein n=1 Tax=Actinacidiphila sp. ITFR-21 TaxID=3075199 RepID=UPI00288B4677|nr:hypothetical protein [Streptomyces sp. ITFR-21]WNI17571.1 hypothetical protein RLT57_19980 [Streptomyces sp. ITFR-21]WNI17711.1 hypothetical protein RLT57_20695 [Streptomyces sp. ITFR-21]
MTVYDWLVSLWRTVIPTLVGFAATALAHVYITINQQALATALMAGFITVYYGLFRLLEARVNPKFGWFLGLARPPSYSTKDAVVPATAAVTPNTPYGQPPV